ncbi:MAG: GyrI-like domain-containing protein [Agriterribacter sp.]
MEKTDLRKVYKAYYSAAKKPEIVQIEPARYLSLRGKGDPSSQSYAGNIQALYATAYTLKFRMKEQQKDFVVASLEGLWWFDEEKYQNVGITDAPLIIPRSEWEYRMLIRMPDFATEADIQKAVATSFSKKQLEAIKKIEPYNMHEGKCIQMLHVGPFNTEPETLLQLQAFSQKHNLHKNGMHHEIYLSDFRKTPQEKLRTILREPVK